MERNCRIFGSTYILNLNGDFSANVMIYGAYNMQDAMGWGLNISHNVL